MAAQENNITYLYFKNAKGDRTLVTSGEKLSNEDINKAILKFLKKVEIPYIRTWHNLVDETIIDYGSWSCFFIKSKIKPSDLNNYTDI